VAFLRGQYWDQRCLTSLLVTDCGIECTLGKFANDIKLLGAVNTPEGRDAIQRDLDRIERWACANLMKFKAKYKVLHMGCGNPEHKYRLGRKLVDSSPEKDFGVLVGEKQNMTQQCTLTAQQANRPLGCIPSSVASRAKEGILPLCSTLVRPNQESCVQLWSPQHRTDINMLELVQRKPQQ